MENIIWLLIIILIIQKILAKAGKTARFPGPRPPVPEKFPPVKDKPVAGPRDLPGEEPETLAEFDAPLPGPWNKDAGERQLEGPQRTAGEDNGEDNRDISRDKRNMNIKIPAAGETAKTGSLSPKQMKFKDRRVLKAPRKAGPERGRGDVIPLYRYLNNRNALAASVILSEIINRRGGRQMCSRKS